MNLTSRHVKPGFRGFYEGRLKPNKNEMIFTHVVAFSFKMSAFVQGSDSPTKRDGGKRRRIKERIKRERFSFFGHAINLCLCLYNQLFALFTMFLSF